MIAVVNTGGANLASILFALERLGKKGILTSDPHTISLADFVILPGVGAAALAMEQLQKAELVECLQKRTGPTLGICLGMQLLFTESEEGNAKCLGVLPGVVRSLKIKPTQTIPHMGWNRVVSAKNNSKLLHSIPDGTHFYFIHSYRTPEGVWVTSRTNYGEEFPATLEKENFFGTQFHPERSGEAGAKVLENFLTL